MKNYWVLILALLMAHCYSTSKEDNLIKIDKQNKKGQEIIVLGIAQDAGYPQIGCKKICCTSIDNDHCKGEWVSCLGLLDHDSKSFYIFDASPDFDKQYDYLKNTYSGYQLAGIFLTHAHIGHYTGLMQLGHEAMAAKNVPVYVMPRMGSFLENNGPWSQLVKFNNIQLMPISNEESIALPNGLKVIPFLVPHRDEFSETVGFKIIGINNTALFIPDINKWNIWKKDIVQEVSKVNYAFLDATFYEEAELPSRNMSEIPHPFVPETKALFSKSESFEKAKIHFIHLNHSNPLLRENTKAYSETISQGYYISKTFELYSL